MITLANYHIIILVFMARPFGSGYPLVSFPAPLKKFSQNRKRGRRKRIPLLSFALVQITVPPTEWQRCFFQYYKPVISFSEGYNQYSGRYTVEILPKNNIQNPKRVKIYRFRKSNKGYIFKIYRFGKSNRGYIL